MSSRAIITRRGIPQRAAAASLESSEAQQQGFTVEEVMPQGTLISGDESQLMNLEGQGYRVKLFANTHLLQVGAYQIDTEGQTTQVPSKLQVPKPLEATWPHHLVQLIAPPTEEWIRAIEAQGVDVVEPIGAYGLFVMGSPAIVEQLRTLHFVAWVGFFQPAYRIAANLQGLSGRINNINVGVYPESEVPSVRQAITGLGGIILDEWDQSGKYQDRFGVLIVELDANKLDDLARAPYVRWLEYQSPVLTADDERSAQILAENLNGALPPNTAPVTGYQGALSALGLSGAGVVVGICDSGVDTNNNATLHPDLVGRMSFFIDTTGGTTPTDTNGHGTHVAGIAVGNAAAGDTDPNGFLLGQGIAPAANFGVLNPVDTAGSPGTGPVGTFIQQMVANGAEVMNNSWRQQGTGGYTANAALVDRRVRDPDPGTAELDYLAIVFSAGNSGPGAGTITPPKEAKNPIIVGNSMNFRPGEGDGDDIRGIRTSSSRGPAIDGRVLPNIVAPGTDIVSTRSTVDANPGLPGVQRPRTAYNDTGGNVHDNYTQMSGTSMAAPHVTGLCALLIEWWRNRTGGHNPSPALLKALLINGAEDLAGGPDGNGGVLTNIPNNDQGWGRVSLENIVLQAPASDRGPKIFTDQRHAFTTNGQEHMIRVAPVDPARPLRITLVWTDAPGAANATPALVNDLDLEVTELDTGNIYKGNVFANGFSVVGGAFDNLNNIECVYLQNPVGVYEIRVIAATISGNALDPSDLSTVWQDFALVIDNAEVPAAAPVSVVPVIDRSSSMVFYGYEDITRTSSKQFVDLMSIDDQLGVVSFGDTGDVEFPSAMPGALQTITGQSVRDDAKNEIDGIAFNGCTFMGDGIIQGRDLLAPAAGGRALLLLSDGYDNKGCDPTNPMKPSALDAVATLPALMPIYTCAMGPSSDQSLLDQIADLTNGRYYYMPTIDDLFEIYNYIRGQVTGTGIIVNESAMASSSRVAAFVDAQASEVTFAISWADTRLRFVANEPEGQNDVNIRLRDPRGRIVHPNSSYVRRVVGEGYVAFKLEEPLPGQWFVEVSTAGNTHVRYTVGGFVKSPLRLSVSLPHRRFIVGMPLTIAAQVFDGKSMLKTVRADAQVSAPVQGMPELLKKFRSQLRDIQPDQRAVGDGVPTNIAKLNTLRDRLLHDHQEDIFAQRATTLKLTNISFPNLARQGLSHLLPIDVPANGNGNGTHAATDLAAAITVPPIGTSGVLAGQFTATQQPGSYNVVVTASGASPFSCRRFVRKQLVSVLLK